MKAHSLRAVLAAIVASSTTWACADPTPLPTTPADAPQQDEARIGGEYDSVSIRCTDEFGKMWKAAGHENPRRVLVTNSPEWGTIWRADTSVADDPPTPWRVVCWQNGILLRPLDMIDPSKSIPPLP